MLFCCVNFWTVCKRREPCSLDPNKQTIITEKRTKPVISPKITWTLQETRAVADAFEFVQLLFIFLKKNASNESSLRGERLSGVTDGNLWSWFQILFLAGWWPRVLAWLGIFQIFSAMSISKKWKCFRHNPSESHNMSDCTKKSVLQWSRTRSPGSKSVFFTPFVQLVYSQIC